MALLRNIFQWRGVLFLVLITGGLFAAGGPNPTREILIYNARVLSPGFPDADAVAILGSRITQVGNRAQCEKVLAPSATQINAGGGFLLAGFHDAHAHLYDAGKAETEIRVRGTNLAQIIEVVRLYAKAHPEKSWLLGRAWNALSFPPGQPTRFDLDRAEAVRPVALIDSTGHNLWVNTAAMKQAGIGAETPDPPGGRIGRDARGMPTGLFYETATYPFWAAQPKATPEAMENYILLGEALSLASGFTAAQGGPVPLRLAQAQCYARLDRDGLLTQRNFLWGHLADTEENFTAMVAFAKSLPKDGRVQVVAFKGFVDGVMGSSTAATLEPYPQPPSQKGLLKTNPQSLRALVVRANRAGFPVALHAIGDLAVRMALDAFAFSRETLHHPLTNRIEHGNLIDPADLPKFKALGLMASVQPAWVFYPSLQAFTPDQIFGAQRTAASLFRWRDLLDLGVPLAFGTDFPVGAALRPDPLSGLNGAIWRQFANGQTWTPDQKIDPDDALRAYTHTPAAAIGFGHLLGKVAPGFEADLVLLTKDPRTKDSVSLAANPVKWVMVGGKIWSPTPPMP